MIRTTLTPAHSLTAEDAVLSIVAASPHHKVLGKKRVHKTSFLCMYCAVPIEARFSIRHFGVFSGEIAGALDFLTAFGDLEMTDEQTGPNGYFMTVYSLPGKHKLKPDPAIAQVVGKLEGYSTPTLEVASTIAYFLSQKCSEADAVRETKRIKPNISTPAHLTKSKALLKELASLRASED